MRQQPGETEAIPFLASEGEGSVERLVVENVEPALHGVRIPWTMATTTGPDTVSRMLPMAYGTV